MNDGPLQPPESGEPSPARVLESLLHAGNLERLEEEARRILSSDPDNADAHFYRLAALIDLARLSEARSHLDFLLSVQPEESRTHLMAVHFFFATRQPGEMRRHISEGLRLDPDNALFHQFAAIADLRDLKVESARKHITRARELDPDDADIVSLALRIRAIEENTAEEAWERVSDYESALALDPHNAGLHDGLGDLYLEELEDPALAEHHYREALRTGPGNRDYQRDLFHAVAKRDLIYRVVSLPSRIFGWLGHVGYVMVRQPWRFLILLVAFKIVIAFFIWLAIVSALFWPAGKVYEWLLVSEIRAGTRASVSHIRLWSRLQRWPRWTRFLLFLTIFAALQAGLFLLLGIPVAAGMTFTGLVAAGHFLVIAALFYVKRLRSSLARRRLVRKEEDGPVPPQIPGDRDER